MVVRTKRRDPPETSFILPAEMYPPGERRLVPVRDAMRYGNWGKTRIYELIAAGKIKGYVEGRRTLVDLNTIDEYRRALPAK
jgi:hypothetical protein